MEAATIVTSILFVIGQIEKTCRIYHNNDLRSDG